jgi:multicomponent Na+:H+ antiporter subunit C
MEFLLAVVIGVLYAGGIYMMLRRSIVKLIIGLALLGHAANLLIFTMGRVARGKPPLVAEAGDVSIHSVADPLPQALILTAIVIGFGVQAFALILIRRSAEQVGTDDLDNMNSTDSLD